MGVQPVAKLAGKASTITWIWLWDALKLLMEYYPRPVAEGMLVRAIAARNVQRKWFSPADETVVMVDTQGAASVVSKAAASDLPIWLKLSGERNDPEILFHRVHWEESTIEAYWRGRLRAFRVKVAREDVLRLLPKGALAMVPEKEPESSPSDRKKPRPDRKKLVQRAAKELKAEKKILPGITSHRKFSRLLKGKIKNGGGPEYNADYLRSMMVPDGVWPISKIDQLKDD
jgi:hypothetical protein